ncbi:hypothetical protein, partial [Bartonella sp. CL74QHWL]|uniref:hypothetical protein n=1 Tax=Bartonella sp. CL74QHWL TaxID=3243541 RepID=UPI0035D10A66
MRDAFAAFDQSEFSGSNTTFMLIRSPFAHAIDAPYVRGATVDEKLKKEFVVPSQFVSVPETFSYTDKVPVDVQFTGKVSSALSSGLGKQIGERGGWGLGAVMAEGRVSLKGEES